VASSAAPAAFALLFGERRPSDSETATRAAPHSASPLTHSTQFAHRTQHSRTHTHRSRILNRAKFAERFLAHAETGAMRGEGVTGQRSESVPRAAAAPRRHWDGFAVRASRARTRSHLRVQARAPSLCDPTEKPWRLMAPLATGPLHAVAARVVPVQPQPQSLCDSLRSLRLCGETHFTPSAKRDAA
jgi:hypothetical protein